MNTNFKKGRAYKGIVHSAVFGVDIEVLPVRANNEQGAIAKTIEMANDILKARAQREGMSFDNIAVDECDFVGLEQCLF